MTRAEPKLKGVGLVPVVKAIKTISSARARVPAHLGSYLEDSIVATGWYPERDYHELITLLASCIEPRQVGGDVWAFFGRAAAQRDIGGDQSDVPERNRVAHTGVYRNFRLVAEDDVPGLFTRMTAVWRLYHDSGRMVFMRHPEKQHVVVSRLLDFSFPHRGLAELQTAYMVEYARLSGFTVGGSLVSSGSQGCEWNYQIASDAGLESSLAKLPAWEPVGGHATPGSR